MDGAALAQVGGTLLQAEDELASINMIARRVVRWRAVADRHRRPGPGADDRGHRPGGGRRSAGGRRRRDARRAVHRHPGQERAERPVDRSHGLHGDAPRLVLAPTSIADCLATTQWAVHLAEALQAPALVLSDQFMGQSRAVIDRPPPPAAFVGGAWSPRPRASPTKRYLRHAFGRLADGVPGTPGTVYTADGLEHNERGTQQPGARPCPPARQARAQARCSTTTARAGPTWRATASWR
jgi:2-oxoglutarate ferredoxin oxidoreductase subunit alpha